MQVLLATVPTVLPELPTWAVVVGTLAVSFAIWWWYMSRDILAPGTKGELPPHMPILYKALTGQYTLAKSGPIAMVQNGYDTHGDIFRIKLGYRGVTFVNGPSGKLFFGSTDEQLSQREVYNFTTTIFGPNIVYDAPPGVMNQQLKFIRTGLASEKMRGYGEKITREVNQYFARWGQTGVVDLHEALSEITVLTASRCLLGDEIRETLHDKVAGLYKHLNDGMTPITTIWPYAPTEAHRLRDSARAEIVSIFSKVINARRATQAQGVRDEDLPFDFLQMLIDSEYRDGSKPTDLEISGLLLAALFAGQHTSAISTTWMGLRIIDAGEKLIPALREEQVRLFKESGGELTFDILEKMELMHNTMRETLRMYPPLVLLMRKVTQQLEYTRESDGKNFSVPVGDILVACPPVAHRLKTVFTDVDNFDPTRFMAPRFEGLGKYQFSPFGGGRHQCLGERFAFLQIKTIWSCLIRNFDFELIDGVPPVDYSAIVAGPKGSCRVRYTRLPKPVC
jgi:sterol 14-demethylase